MARKRLFSLTLMPMLALFADTAISQDAIYAPTEPATVFSAGAAFLTTTRDTHLTPGGPFISGPDSAAIGFDDADLGYKSGVRAFLAMSSNGVRIEAIYSDFGAWNSETKGSLTNGLSFDEGITGSWTGANSINLTTGFESLHAAASGAMGGDSDEHEGLGPGGGFAGDVLPKYTVLYRSTMQTFELNAVTEDPASRVQFGLGYRNFQLDELASVGIEGSLRAMDIGAPNGGLSHGALTTFGGLSHLGGTANGFEDETSNTSALPDTLQMFHNAVTSNDLNGAQLIFSEQIMYWKGWTIDGIGKAGVYHNHVRGTVSERYIGTDPGIGGDSSTYGRQFTDTKSQLAFAGSVGLQSNFPLSERWSVIGGYEMTYIYGVALSPEQYAAVTGPTFVGRTYNVDSHGDLIAHGGNLGLQFRY